MNKREADEEIKKTVMQMGAKRVVVLDVGEHQSEETAIISYWEDGPYSETVKDYTTAMEFLGLQVKDVYAANTTQGLQTRVDVRITIAP